MEMLGCQANVVEVWDAEVLPKLGSPHYSASISAALKEKHHGEPVCIPFIVSLCYLHWEMKSRVEEGTKKRKLVCLSRNWWVSIHGVYALLTLSSTGSLRGSTFSEPPTQAFLAGENQPKSGTLCADSPSSALELASLAFELEVEAVGIVVGMQGAGEARGHRGVTQARLSLAPALLITCKQRGKHGALRCLPGRSHRGGRDRAACPGARPPQPASILNAHFVIPAAGNGAGFNQGMLS